MGLSFWTTCLLTPFRLDGLALGAFLAVTARQPEGLMRLVRALPLVVTIVSGLTGGHLHLDPSDWRRTRGGLGTQ